MNKRVLINLAFFLVIFGVLALWAVQNIVTFRIIERPYAIKGDFAAASGVQPNAEVAYLGVHFGHVTAVELVPGGVRMTMDIDREREIPVGSIARIFRKSAIGEPYIDFIPPPDFDPDADDIEFYESGDVVPIEDTQNPLEFSELLRTASNLISRVDPEQAGILIHELALALDGRAEDLRRLTTGSDQLAQTFADRTEALDRLATNNTRITHVLAEHRGSLGQTITDLGLLAESLRNARGDVSVLLDRGVRLLAEAGDLLEDSEANINCILGDLVPVIERSGEAQRLDGTRTLLDVGPRAFGLLFNTRDQEVDGVWVRVNLLINPDQPSNQYDPPHSLPTPPIVPACPGVTNQSVSTPVPGSDFVPGDFVGGGGLPATGAAALGSLASVLGLGALAARWVSRRA